MANVREPLVQPTPILSLRPTQMTVGMREVKEKRQRWREHKSKKKQAELLGKHMIPVVHGPDDRFYVIDHHHLALSLQEEGVKNVLVTVVADLSELDPEDFWLVLDHHSWVHPYDENGRRRDFSKIPKSIDGLKDDPFRSLAGELRRVGGFAKDTTPFSEFLWADFLRRRISKKIVEKNFAKAVEKDFPAAVKKAMKLAKSLDARYLPGWCGPVDS